MRVMALLALIVYYVLQAYTLLIFVWVFGSWFPRWRYERWYQTVGEIVMPYLNLFRGLPLRVGMMDLTPLVAVVVLSIFQRLVLMSAGGLH
jgi:YggT family protein